ncbi:hypothetical protein ATANTOWER_014778 [Ataeniobius toweri]|uniref:Uncharacterized protein n=1 Tax=Ataeniobius toweri TaxID=208326 RepID=A0ABU7CBJ1_9TELE|nr:hypothetical protein [Ataeniobius toweri]
MNPDRPAAGPAAKRGVLLCFSFLPLHPDFSPVFHGCWLSGIYVSLAAFSLARRQRAGIPSWVHWHCSSGSLLTAPLITQGHNHRPL